MKNIFSTGLLFLMIIVLALQSCGKKTENFAKENSTHAKTNLKEAVDTFKSRLRFNENIQLGKIYTDTIQFVNFDDNGDDWLFFVKKNKDTVGLIYNKDNPEFIRGDELEIQWKMDSLRPAGDPEYLDYKEYLISAKVIKPLKLTDKKIQFLWRETLYDKKLATDINTIVLNENYLKNISDPEKAALAYVATFIGNECTWDGEANDNRGNLKCKILTALDLGYQCSEQHLGFLRFWFRNNKEILKELENCPTTPDGATIQDTFDEIRVEVSENKIIIFFRANGINLREGKSWNWTEKHFFEFRRNELVLLKKEVSPIKHSNFDVRGN